MRRFLVLVRATAQEIGSEPLALLLTLSAMALAFLAPGLHYHQFGDARRMAMESGFSAQLILGFVYVVVCTVRSFRREIESGTLQMVLAHSVSRRQFFMAKLTGAFLSYLLFAVTVFSLTVTVTRGAAIGAAIARETHDIPRLFGPTVALATGAVLAPLALAAGLNYFFRMRFTWTATRLLAVAAVGTSLVFPDGRLWLRMVPQALLLAFPTAALLAAAAAFAARYRANVATSLAGLVALLALPVFGNYYVPGALARGGHLALSYLFLAGGAALPFMLAFVLLGWLLFENRELGGE